MQLDLQLRLVTLGATDPRAGVSIGLDGFPSDAPDAGLMTIVGIFVQVDKRLLAVFTQLAYQLDRLAAAAFGVAQFTNQHRALLLVPELHRDLAVEGAGQELRILIDRPFEPWGFQPLAVLPLTGGAQHVAAGHAVVGVIVRRRHLGLGVRAESHQLTVAHLIAAGAGPAATLVGLRMDNAVLGID